MSHVTVAKRRRSASAVIYLLDPMKDIQNVYTHTQFQSACKRHIVKMHSPVKSYYACPLLPPSPQPLRSPVSAIHARVQHYIGDVPFFPFGDHFLTFSATFYSLARLLFSGATFFHWRDFFFGGATFFLMARLFYAGATFFCRRHFFLLARLFFHWRDFFSVARLFFGGATFFLLARLFFVGATFFHWRDFFSVARLFFRWRDFFLLARLFFAGATFSLELLCTPLLDLLRAQTMNTCS